MWRKSSRSGTTNCLEVASSGSEILVRDSKDPDGPTLAIGRGSWAAFVEALKLDATGEAGNHPRR
ncbi:DUF397 domain-containing protein [Dactylosporangium matsuzakiense]|uniref:DUF397 domain-containing protein n=1 Tax=Dactylosporangium matsuzakiense TaxID=53360 RepID=UPI002795F356|nr:DUF397 domain-containing protein [Dactylosporangium matsuzakiense]